MERPLWLVAVSTEGSVNEPGKLCAHESKALGGTCHFDSVGSGPGGRENEKEGRKIFIVMGRQRVGQAVSG